MSNTLEVLRKYLDLTDRTIAWVESNHLTVLRKAWYTSLKNRKTVLETDIARMTAVPEAQPSVAETPGKRKRAKKGAVTT